jgi:transcriptional regulator with XRE-family HTH domain
LGLDQKELGNLIRTRRKEKDLTLKEVSAKLGISLMTLQRIEMGQTAPSFFLVADLARILDLPVRDLMGEKEPAFDLLRKSDQKRIESELSVMREIYSSGMLAEKLTVNFVSSKAGYTMAEHMHQNIIAIFNLTGKARFVYGGQEYIVNEGDAIYFDSSVPHSYQVLEDVTCVCIAIKK